MWFQPQLQEDRITRKMNPVLGGSIGGGIGFLSGMVGIGGGIFLSPLLHLMLGVEDDCRRQRCLFWLIVLLVLPVRACTCNSLGVAYHSAIDTCGCRWTDWSRMGISYFSQVTVKRATVLLILMSVYAFITSICLHEVEIIGIRNRKRHSAQSICGL
jgi:hypothetical protein